MDRDNEVITSFSIYSTSMTKSILSLFIILSILAVSGCTEQGTDITKLNAPAPGAVVYAAANELQVSWQNPENSNITGIRVDRLIGEGIWDIAYKTFPSDVESFTDSLTIEPNVVIAYRFMAFSSDDSSKVSDAVAYFNSATTPTYLSGKQIDDDRVYLNWTDNSIGEEAFIIDRKTANAEWQSDYTIVDANSTEAIINVSSSSDSVSFRVSAKRGISKSEYSSPFRLKIYNRLTLGNLRFGDDNYFDILTWNVQNFPRLDDGTVDSLARAINALQVDIIAFQEIESESGFRTLLDSLNSYNGYRANSAYGNMDLAYIYNSHSVTVDSIYEIYKYENAFPRRPLVMHCHWRGTPLIIIDNHYKAYGDEESQERRYTASVMLVDYIQHYFDSDNVIILGDFNDELTDTRNTNVFQPFIDLPDEFFIADMSIALGGSSKWSYPTYPSHIDHIIISNELLDEFERGDSEITTLLIDNYFTTGWNSYALYISDHRPVGLKLQF